MTYNSVFELITVPYLVSFAYYLDPEHDCVLLMSSYFYLFAIDKFEAAALGRIDDAITLS